MAKDRHVDQLTERDAHPVTDMRSQQETRLCSKVNFKRECQVKYNEKVYEDFCLSFDYLPLAAVVNNSTFCVHGGFSPSALSLDDIDNINRFTEPAPRGALTDILWSDPDPNFSITTEASPCFTFNEERSISVYFSYEAFLKFMKRNGLTCLIRANQPLFDGFLEYPMPAQPEDMKAVSMKSIFSAPNFKGKRNQGAILLLTPKVCQVQNFLWVASPYWLPDFVDCFTWSLPFLVKKATHFVRDLLELMDRDTAASDVKAALQRNQERSNVLSSITKETRDRAKESGID
ncbi:serine/threonine-protein phosphatase [Plakobranchus ocellatus]|uniref:Serine/threonine-protein phosphatase n=1 Tax=Plakobranchus ocellatus TaxID=259542 RepID=A0AAV3YHV0_9GAST|nr:serine/threonine-protein phosphatase [Plakobranchus ocellatus]